MRAPLSICVVFVLAIGCDDDPPETPPTPPDEAEVVETSGEQAIPAPTQTQQGMHERYEVVEDMLYALIDGDTDDARTIAEELGPVAIDPMPAAATPFRDIIPTRARAFAEARTSGAATEAFAHLVRGCGECHAAAGVDWLLAPPAVPDGEELPGHMRRHEWAMVRMHEGLVVGDAARFDLGARALEEAPIVNEVPPEDEHPPGLSAVETEMHSRARDARTAEDLAARAAIYGELLDHCAVCHREIDELDRQAGD